MTDWSVEKTAALERLRDADRALSAAQDERRAAQAAWDWLNVPAEVVTWYDGLEVGSVVYRSAETKTPWRVWSFDSEQRSMILGHGDVSTPVSAPELEKVYRATMAVKTYLYGRES